MAIKDWKKINMNGTRYRKGDNVLNINQNIKTKRWYVGVRSSDSDVYNKHLSFYSSFTKAKNGARGYMRKH